MAGIILDIEGREVGVGDKVYFTTHGSEYIVKGTVTKQTAKFALIVGDGDDKWWKARIDRNLTRNSRRVIKL